MHHLRAAPTLGLVGSALALVLVLAPYAALDAGSVAAYYGAGALTPLAVGLFAAVGVVLFAAGREGRTAPDTAAGAGLTLGLFTLGAAAAWAFTLDWAVVFQLGRVQWLAYHPGALVVTSAVPVVASAWYARAVGAL
jgi:hypothetical protein